MLETVCLCECDMFAPSYVLMTSVECTSDSVPGSSTLGALLEKPTISVKQLYFIDAIRCTFCDWMILL